MNEFTNVNNLEATEKENEEEKQITYPSKKDIEKKAELLKTDILGLQTKIKNILEKHHTDYLGTFDEFMESVKIDLKQKIEQMEKVEKEKRKVNDIRIITSERDFFRQEAIRLNQLCRELSIKVEDIEREMKFQAGEIINISNKWKESENANKQLIVELERNIRLNKELENENYKQTTQIKNINNQTTHDIIQQPQGHTYALGFTDRNNEIYSNDEIYEIENNKKEKLYKKIELLKSELKKERTRNHFVISEFNKVLKERENLENVFNDCVEQTRKEIFHRRLKDVLPIKATKTVTNFNKIPSVNTLTSNNININDVKYEQFLPSDKKKLIEAFLTREEILNLVKDTVFKKIDGSSIYKFKYPYNEEMNQIKNSLLSFNKTDKLFSITNMRKKNRLNGIPGLDINLQIKSAKTVKIGKINI